MAKRNVAERFVDILAAPGAGACTASSGTASYAIHPRRPLSVPYQERGSPLMALVRSGRPWSSTRAVPGAARGGPVIDAVTDENTGGLGTALRKPYLTPAFRKELNAGEDANHANGVLRAQNVPLALKVTDNGTAGRTEAVVTLTWSEGVTSTLIVDMTRGHKISRWGEGC